MTDFTEDTSPTSDDLIWTTNNPSGTPSDRKVSLGNLLLWMATQDITFTGTNTFSEVTNFKGNGSSTTGKTCYYDTPGTGYVCIQAPGTISTPLNITMPSSLPGTNLPLWMSDAGVLYTDNISTTGGTNYALGVWDNNSPAVLDSLDTGTASSKNDEDMGGTSYTNKTHTLATPVNVDAGTYWICNIEGGSIARSFEFYSSSGKRSCYGTSSCGVADPDYVNGSIDVYGCTR